MTRLLTLKEVAQRLGVSYGTASLLKDELKAFHLPGRRSWSVDPAEVEALIESRKAGVILALSNKEKDTQTHENVALPEQRQKQGKGYQKGWHEQLTRK